MHACSLRLALALAIAAALPLAPAMAATATARASLSTTAKFDASAIISTGTYDRFIVRYVAGSAAAANPTLVASSVSAALASAGNGRANAASFRGTATYLRRLAIGADVVKLPSKLKQADALAFIQTLSAQPDVAFVEVDAMDQPLADTVVPNDPLYATKQWDLTDPDAGINASKAWGLSTGSGVTVAVIDTGVTKHPDLDTSLAAVGYDFISDASVSGRATAGRVAGGWDTGDWVTAGQCGSGSEAAPSSWHGTHVFGTVAESTNNALGSAGVAYGSKVVPVRALGHCGGSRSDIADAIVWAAGGSVSGASYNANPARVINMSIGGTGTCSPGSAYGQAIALARSRGAIVVVAAGNNTTNVSNTVPAICDGVITVGAIGNTTRRAFYSNYGAGVDIAAPGGGIYANDAASGDQVDTGFIFQALNDGTTVPGNPIYAGLAGTSMASPHVAGIVALILSEQIAHKLTPYDVDDMRNLLQATARPFKVAQDPAMPIGTGIVDAYAALSSVLASATPKPAILTTAVPLSAQSITTANAQRIYAIDVPAGSSSLLLRTYGGTGDISLYVGAVGSVPTTSVYTAKSARTGNTESVTLSKPAAGRYYVMVTASAAAANFSVLGLYSAAH